MLSAQELNVIGKVNFSVETNVLEFKTLVIVAVTVFLIIKPTIITVVRNLTPLVKPGMETFYVKENHLCGISNAMDLVHKRQEGEKPYYPVMTNRDVIY